MGVTVVGLYITYGLEAGWNVTWELVVHTIGLRRLKNQGQTSSLMTKTRTFLPQEG